VRISRFNPESSSRGRNQRIARPQPSHLNPELVVAPTTTQPIVAVNSASAAAGFAAVEADEAEK
jgi:hypothetical protein